jgi:hypothetical protein
MTPLVVTPEEYATGNYPKDTPIMVGMSVDLKGRSKMNAGQPTKIVVKMKAA